MASVKSPIRTIVKPLFYKILGRKGYRFIQCRAKVRDIKMRLVEEKEMVLLPVFIKKGDTVLDLGANYAYYVERMSKLVNSSGRVIAFEPIPFTHDVCKMIIKRMRLNNVILHKYAAHIKDETLKFRVPKLNFGGISAGQSHLADRNNEMEGKENYYSFNSEELVVCEGRKLDNLLLNDLDNLSFIKIDIEGGEYFALRGMEGIIRKFNPTILVEIQPFFLKGLDIKEEELVDFIKSLDYDLYSFNSEENKLHVVNDSLWDDNYLLIHKSKVSNYPNILS